MLRPVDMSKAAPLFIEIPSDEYEIRPRLELEMTKRGFSPVNDPAARYVMKANYSRTRTRIDVAIQIFDSQTGDRIYQGQANNPGFGTAFLVGKADIIWGSFETALQGFK